MFIQGENNLKSTEREIKTAHKNYNAEKQKLFLLSNYHMLFLSCLYMCVNQTVKILIKYRIGQSVVSGYRCESDCRSRGCKFDPGPVIYFRGD